MKTLLLLLGLLWACLLVAGCAASKVVTVGEPGEKGVYARQIEKAKDVSAQASERQREGEKDVSGG